MNAVAVPSRSGLLYPYQVRWIKDKARFKLGRFARQTGKTFTTTLEIVDDVAEAEIRSLRSPWVILSRGERQALEAMEEGVMRHQAAYGAAMKVAREDTDFYDEESGIRRRALQLIYPNGNKISALPANPDTARGFSANVFLDEFAFHKDSRKIWTALFPVISAGWRLRVTSTPNGKGNKFYDLSTGDDSIWSRHVVDIHQAIADGLPRNADELRAALMDEDAWSQEFLLEWLDEASSWLSYDLINSVEHDHAGIPDHYTGGPCYVGVDIAARNDNFVIWVDELVGDVLWTREVIVKKRISFAEQDALQDDVEQRYNVVRYCMDQTSMGEKPVEDAKRRYGVNRVEGILFNSSTKMTMATLIKQSFEDRKSRIPMADEKLRSDLHKVRKIPSPTGVPRFDADSDANGHADRFWAKALSCLAAHGAAGPVRVASARPPSTKSVAEQLKGYLT
ncbi:MAG: terminase family protein [Comamonas sp.]|uniref:terminase large subunit domain-containing protein n=1 Tax=Comamonas sp. TaxID=34028 RepID=UPI002FCB88C1